MAFESYFNKINSSRGINLFPKSNHSLMKSTNSNQVATKIDGLCIAGLSNKLLLSSAFKDEEIIFCKLCGGNNEIKNDFGGPIKCGHRFHSLCINRAIIVDKITSCPTCSTPIERLIFNEEDIWALPSLGKSNESMTELEKTSKCEICYETMNGKNSSDIAAPVGCSHFFHFECIKRWLIDEKHSHCPVCSIECSSLKTENDESMLNVPQSPRRESTEIEEMQQCIIPNFSFKYSTCNLCDNPLTSNEEYGRPYCCENEKNFDHEFHLECLLNFYSEEGAYCPLCGNQSYFIVNKEGRKIYYDQWKKEFYVDPKNDGNLVIFSKINSYV